MIAAAAPIGSGCFARVAGRGDGLLDVFVARRLRHTEIKQAVGVILALTARGWG